VSAANPFRLDGRVAVVTGALGNLGPVWADALLQAGATVVGLDLPGSRPTAAFAALQATYGESKLTLLDASVTDRAALVAARDQILATTGVPAVLVNNAGIDQPPAPLDDARGGLSDSRRPAGGGYLLEDIPFEVNRRILEVNTLGLFQVTQIFGTEMVKAGRGSIINIGSLYASVSPDPTFYDHIVSDPPFLKPPAYGASKAAVVNLTKYLATAWGRHGVRVNTLSPGGVLGAQDDQFKRKFNERVPLGRMAVHQDLIGPLQFLASDASAYGTGAELRVDGGFTAW
jgi:NAD(P)-dependent dehydrogenase (short-subunit alcohol dehydrogenase family)